MLFNTFVQFHRSIRVCVFINQMHIIVRASKRFFLNPHIVYIDIYTNISLHKSMFKHSLDSNRTTQGVYVLEYERASERTTERSTEYFIRM